MTDLGHDALARFGLIADGPLARFTPWRTPSGESPQSEFFAAGRTHAGRLFRAANRCGKTTSGIIETVNRCLGLLPWAPPPPVRGWVSALDWKFGIGQVVWPEMKRWIPMDRVRSITWMRKREPEIPEDITFDNGSSISFRSVESGRLKYQGADLDFVWFDEEHPADIFEESMQRLLHRRGSWWMTMTPIMRQRWIQELEKDEDVRVVRATQIQAAEAGLLPKAEVDAALARLPERQRRVRGFGEYAAVEGLVWPEFDERIHILRPHRRKLVDASGTWRIPWSPPKAWPRRASIDFGYKHPTAVVCGAVVPPGEEVTPGQVSSDAGELVIYLVPHARYIRASVWARILFGDDDTDGILPTLAGPLVADHQADQRAEFEARGIRTAAARKSVQLGLDAVERWMHVDPSTGRPRLWLVVYGGGDSGTKAPHDERVGRYDAAKLAWEIPGYRYPEGASGTRGDLPLKEEDDACDALRYLVMELEGGGYKMATATVPSGLDKRPAVGYGGGRRSPPAGFARRRLGRR